MGKNLLQGKKFTQKRQYNRTIEKIELIKSKIDQNEVDDLTKQGLPASLTEAKVEMEIMVAEKACSATFRSRAQWVQESEKNTKYFFNLERNKYNQKVMKQIYQPDNSIATSPKGISTPTCINLIHRFLSNYRTSQVLN